MEEPKFNVGRVAYTPMVARETERNKDLAIYIEECMARHMRGDWGDVSEQGKKENEKALLNGGRLVSYYAGTGYCRNIVIVTADNRLYTTVMYPQEY